MHVAVRNYKEPCRVEVTHEKSGAAFFDSDTLLLRDLDHPPFDSFLLRYNTSADSYYFIAPTEKEVSLRPIALGNPIKQVEIIKSSEPSMTINLLDRKQFRKLKKSGMIKTKGFIFTMSIFIENK
jgi:hypothetical protein